jgi:hypothetical protein
MGLELIRQPLGIRGGQVSDGGQAEAKQEITALSTDTADLAQMTDGGGLLVTKSTPTAEHALLAVVDQIGRIGPS